MNIVLKSIPKENVIDVWANIAGWVQNSLGIDKSTKIEDIHNMCLNGAVTLWVIYKNGKSTGFLTTMLNPSVHGKTCYAPWLGGENLGDWVVEGFEQLKKYLKEQNCLSFSWIGREAWKKLVDVDSDQHFYTINLTKE